jgi:hypothetical protein
MPLFLGEADLALELSLWVSRDYIVSNGSELGTYETETLSRSSSNCSHLEQELCKVLGRGRYVGVALPSPSCEI